MVTQTFKCKYALRARDGPRVLEPPKNEAYLFTDRVAVRAAFTLRLIRTNSNNLPTPTNMLVAQTRSIGSF